MRARTWAGTWAFLATQEEADEEDVEQIVDVEEEILVVVRDSASPSASWSRQSNLQLKLVLLGLERMTRPAAPLQQSDSLL